MGFLVQKFIEGSIWCLGHPLHTLISLLVLCIIYFILMRLMGYDR